MNEKITILMPSLNVAKYIEQCMDSVVNQTYHNLEIIVIDAGSTDGTLEILNKYAQSDSRIRIIHSDKKSYGYQMNIGLREAAGDYIGIVETDDYIVPDMYETLLITAREYDADYVKGYARVVRELNGKDAEAEAMDVYPINKGFVGRLVNPSEMIDLYSNDRHHWLGLYRRHFLDNIRFNETPGAAFQDQGFLLKTISSAHRAVYIDKQVYFYRLSNGDASGNSTQGFKYIYQEYQLNECYAKSLGEKWYDAFWGKMFSQICSRYYEMAKSEKFWLDAVPYMDLLRDWLKQAVIDKCFFESDLGREDRMRLQYFIEDNRALFDYYKNPSDYNNKRNIEKALNAKHVWIYGAGIVGTRAAKELNRGQYGNKVKGITVSGRGEYAQIEGYDVQCIDDISTNPSETLFLIAVSTKYQDEVIDTLESKGYQNYIIWNEFWGMRCYLVNFGFTDRKRDLSRVCFVLSGYKEFLWDGVFGRLKRFVPDDVEVCILSSGVYSEKLETIAEDNGWSYLHTALNDLTLVQNIALYIFDRAEWVYKMDEDMFLTDKCFEKLYGTYERILDEEPYHVGFVAPLIPMNGYGYIHLLRKYDGLSEYERLFETAKFGGLKTHQLECNPAAARFMWGAGSGLPFLDEMNRDCAGSDKYGVCGVRFSIGFILYRRGFWEEIGWYGVSGTVDLGRDERELCYNSIIRSNAMIVAHNTVVGHFSFGPQTEAMKEFYHDNPEYFEIREV
jgi:glycosyltransferase involved in cell wall biosynthesis